MSADRLDDLLDDALRAGAIPREATPEERGELAPLLAAEASLRALRAKADAESEEFLPAARARFQRFLVAESAGATAKPVPRPAASRGWLGGLFALPRAAAIGGPLALAAAVAVVAVIVFRGSFGGVDTAVALESGDYVQMEGTVDSLRERSDGFDVVINSSAGRFAVKVDGSTALRDAGGQPATAALVRGAVVVVDGVVRPDGSVAAATVALGTHALPPVKSPVRKLKESGADLEGSVLLLQLSEDGSKGSVVVLLDSGERLVVPVNGSSLEDVLRRFSTAVGERVEVEAVYQQDRLFRLRVPGGDEPLPGTTPASGRPSLIDVRGLAAAISVERLEVRTATGTRIVRISPRTRFLIERSGLRLDDVRDGKSVIGHTVSVTGRTDPKSGEIVADLVIVGPKPAPPTRPAR